MFKFRLDGVLNYRRQIEDDLERGLADINRLLKVEKERLISYKDERGRYQREFYHKQVDGISIDEMRLYLDFLNGLDKTIQEQEKIVSLLFKRADLKREEVITAMKNRKILETIRTRRWDEYQQKEKRAEQALLDEIAGRGNPNGSLIDSYRNI
ncbi:MAG: flagellar export protein FliJ [Nitrospinae bacterium]|nr:flagellar export protein FliJ [Nitrospinota bacterium]